VTVLYDSVPLAYVARATNVDEPLFFDLESTGLYVDPVLVQFKQPSWDRALEVEYPNYKDLQDFLRDKHVVCFPIAFDCGTMDVAPRKIDCMYIAAKTAYPLLEKHSLDLVCPEVFFGVPKKEMQKSFMKKRMAFTEEQLHYGALDVYALDKLWHDPKIQKVISTNLAYKVDIKNQLLALSFQHNGMPVIAKEWQKAWDSTIQSRDEYQAELNSIVGRELNVKSWKQKQECFPELPFNDKGKQPTDEKAFKKLYLEAPSEEEGRKYKLVLDTTKMRTRLSDLAKYEESYYPQEDPVRIRTFFNVAGAITGRYSSKGGDRVGYTNIQNIGRHFKHIFGYEESAGRKIISADYGTAELIAGCAIFKVPTMRELIMEGVDLHKAMASEITKKPIEEITKDERQAAKAVNFGYLFGMGAEKFMHYAYDTYGVKMTIEEAKEYKAIYYDTHPAIADYHKQMGKNVKKPNFTVMTALGRVVHPQRYADALNIPVQGSIGETTKMSINYLYEDYASLMKEHDCQLINMVHDNDTGDAPNEYAEDMAHAIKSSMLLAWREISKSRLFHYHDLPMTVDVEIANHFK